MATPAELFQIVDAIADAVSQRLLDQPRLVDRQGLSRIIHLSVATIDRRVRTGEIPAIRTGSRVLFDPSAVIKAMTTSGGDNRG